jgi:hypothetical protein
MTETNDPTPDALGDATASELVEEMKTADAERAQAVWDQEAAKPDEKQRVTVLRAAETRLEELAPVVDAPGGEVLEAIPDRGWAQLLDGDGNPVEVDGQPVETDLVP